MRTPIGFSSRLPSLLCLGLVSLGVVGCQGATDGSPEPPLESCGNGVDDDADGEIDCADPDCDPSECRPIARADRLITRFQVAVEGGEITQYSYDGATLENRFVVALIDSTSWTGWDDVDDMCEVAYAVDGADPADGFDGAYQSWYLAWDIEGASLPEVSDACFDLSPDQRAAVAGWVDGWSWSIAFSDTMDPGIASWLGDELGPDLAGAASSAVGSFTRTDFGDGSGYAEVNYGLVYAVDDGGELAVEGSDFVFEDVKGSSGAVDGYYTASAYAGWSL